MKQQLPVEQILDIKVMEPFFREHLAEIVPNATEFRGVDLKMIRRFDGPTFYNKNIPVTTIRARYKIKYREKSAEKQVVLYGKATSTFITEPGRMSRVQKYLYEEIYTDADLQVIRPLGYYKDQNILLRFEAPGFTLRSLIEDPGDKKQQIETGLVNAARWIARLHQIKKVPKYFPRKDDFALMRHFERIFKNQGPKSLQTEYQKLYNKFIELSYEQEAWFEKKLIHGDFHPDNVFVTDQGLMAIDFDDMGMSDPAQDLGSFLVQFRNMVHNVELEQINAWQKLFLEKYFAVSEIGNKVDERINLMQARTIFKNLSHHIARKTGCAESEDKIKLDLEHIRQLIDLVESGEEILINY